MKNIILVIFCAVIVFFQLSVEGTFFGQQRIPDLALALVITFTVALGFSESIKWILFTGILLDMGSSAIFGTTALIFFLVGWATSSFGTIADMRSKKILFLAALAFVAAFAEILKDLALVASARIKTHYSQNTTNFLSVHFDFDYFLKILYTVLATYAVYWIFRRMSKFFFSGQERTGRMR
jgi:rod shape-determining protein MreD